MIQAKVLSIQSHVVAGYVGNKCATFPLQLLGIEVDSINSVQLSNHTGYPVHPGQVLNSTQLEELVDGLRANLIFNYSHVVTGYVGNAGFLKKLVEVITDSKSSLPNLLYICDPVMGDNGTMYVPKDLLPIYRDQLLPLADLITPNQFEAELLSGLSISSEMDALRAMDLLHKKGASKIVITGTDLEKTSGLLVGFASDGVNQWRFDAPLIEGHFTGTGDLFTSVLTGWMARGYDLQASVERAVSTLQHVLRRSLNDRCHNGDCCGDGLLPVKSSTVDLQVVKSKTDIENPDVIVKLIKLRLSCLLKFLQPKADSVMIYNFI